MPARRAGAEAWMRRTASAAVIACAATGLAVWRVNAPAGVQAPAPPASVLPAGRATFEARCATCHGANANGGEMGPPIATRLPSHDDADLTQLIREGRPTRGMPPPGVPSAEIPALIAYLRTLQREPSEGPPPQTFHTVDGRTFDARVVSEGFNDVQVRTADGRIHLLRHASNGRVREVTSEEDWPTYNGGVSGNRYTTLTEIDRQTVSRLAPRWMFALPSAGQLQVTPIVVQGVMYVAAPNECFALDAGSGRLIWHYRRPRTRGVSGGDKNRGVAVAGDRVFMETDNAHLIALDRFSGALLWDEEMGDWHENYFSTSAPLPAGDLVIGGVSGGEHGANGFVVAYEQATGKEVWRFATVPKPGAPGSETWQGNDLQHGGAPTWFTGSYDPELDVVYWPVGNPSKEYNGDHRAGDNLYADCLLALDRRTGRLVWHYQFTPHDLWDWDATQTSVVVDAAWQGQPRKLILHADRNGFFYVFDRTNGALLLAKPFVKNLTWASGIDANGRPITRPGQEPTPEGTRVCPSQDGATNWFSPSFNPTTGLYYVQTFEKCSIYTKRDDGPWQEGKTFLGGSQEVGPDPTPARVLKAIDVRTGDVRWTLPQPGPATSWGGTLATSTGLVIFGEESGSLVAADAATGQPLWSFPTNQAWRASPMVYEFDHHEYIAVASGSTILAFGLAP